MISADSLPCLDKNWTACLVKFGFEKKKLSKFLKKKAKHLSFVKKTF